MTFIVVFALMLASQDTTIRLGTLAPKDSSWGMIIRDMTEDWKKASGGKIRVRILAGGVAGDEPAMVQQMRIDELHAAALTGVGLAEIAPELMAMQMPMMLRSYDELDYVMEKMRGRLEDILRQKGFVVLNWGDAGWVHFFSKHPVVRPDDLKPRKLFVWAGNNLDVEVWRKFGCNPVPLAAPDILPGLGAGLIDTYSTTPLAALSFQWFGLTLNMTDLRWAPLIGATVITRKKWESLPADLRPVWLKAAADAGVRFRQETRKKGDDAVEAMKKRGLVIHPVPPDAAAQWEGKARQAYPDLMKKIPADLVGEVERLRDEFRGKKGAQ